MARKQESSDKHTSDSGFKIGGILGGLENLLKRLEELSETAGELSKSGEISGGEKIRGVYGFSVKMASGGDGVKVEPFGTVRTEKKAKTGESRVAEIREPMVDVFEEKDFVVVVAEMPGIAVDDLVLDLKDDILTISADKKDKKYRKEVLLSEAFTRDKMSVSCNNGVVEIKFAR